VHRDVALGVVVQNGERGRVDGLREADDRAHRFRLLTGHERETRGERERKGESNRHALVKSKIRTRPLDGSNRWILNGSSLTGRDASLPDSRATRPCGYRTKRGYGKRPVAVSIVRRACRAVSAATSAPVAASRAWRSASMTSMLVTAPARYAVLASSRA
jgi:hypothetical protein